MTYYDQHEIIKSAGMHKYKYLCIPMIVIIICFFLTPYFDFMKYISLLAIVKYAKLLLIFRFNRSYSEPEVGEIVSPINGKITDIEKIENGSIITIKKPAHYPCEIITSSNSDIINSLETDNDRVSWKITNYFQKIYYDENVNKPCSIVGISPGKATCEIFIPHRYKLNVGIGDKVEAGEGIGIHH